MKRVFFIWLSVVLLLGLMLGACSPITAPTESVAEPTAEMTEEVMEEPAAEMTEEVMEEAVEEPVAEMPESMIELPEVDPAAVTGDFTSAGSSTVFPLAEAIQTLFESEGYASQHTIASIGSGGGFERFCVAGETDISNASRAIKDSEVESCAAINRTPIEFQVGIDAIAVTVSNENDFLTDFTSEELAKIFSSDAVNWSDVRAEWPAEAILRYAPGTDSGTFDFFIEFVMEPAYIVEGGSDDAGKEAFLAAENLQLSEDDNVLVQGVEGSPYAIGFFGFAYYTENEGALKAVSIDGVVPNAESAESGDYLLSRPLFLYSDAAIMQAKPQVAAYINFFLSRVDEVIGDVGYFPVSEETLNQSKQAWLDAVE